MIDILASICFSGAAMGAMFLVEAMLMRRGSD